VGQFVYEGVQCYVYPPPVGKIPIHGLYNPSTSKHSYTADVTYARKDWNDLGAKFWIYSTEAANTQPLLVYKNTMTHIVQLSLKKFTNLGDGWIESDPIGWAYEKISDYSGRSTHLTALHRYYNANLNDNYFTTDQTVFSPGSTMKKEGDNLWNLKENNTEGWKYEGVVGYVFDKTKSIVQ